MYHGSRQKNSVLPLTRSRKQLPLPQFPSTLILGSVQKEVEMPLYKDLVLYSFRKTTLSPMQAGLGNRLNSVTQIEKELLAQRTQPSVRLWQKSYSLYRSQALGIHLEKAISICTKRLQRRLLRLQQYDAEIRNRPGREMYLADTLSGAY